MSSHETPPAVLQLTAASTPRTKVLGKAMEDFEGSCDGTGDGGTRRLLRWNLDDGGLRRLLAARLAGRLTGERLGGELGFRGNGELVVMSNLSSSMSSQMAPVSLLVPFTNIQHSTWCWHSAQSSESQWSCSPYQGQGQVRFRDATSRSVVTSWNVKSKSVMLKSTLQHSRRRS
jgi:hypothetical protein